VWRRPCDRVRRLFAVGIDQQKSSDVDALQLELVDPRGGDDVSTWLERAPATSTPALASSFIQFTQRSL
jgi:hypothetical protein